ncbi:hypothetical protein ACFYTQ_35590 [Nocardia sp. NPDC004068]|uniref:hypothetical protein n=1 Tax=Nocardia sp. NPDC004068 TaxID=3364303 RepID=UPI0036CD1C29
MISDDTLPSTDFPHQVEYILPDIDSCPEDFGALSKTEVPVNAWAENALSPSLTLVLLLCSRVRELVDEVNRLRSLDHCLLVALDDCLDRESGHALCAHNERLVRSTPSFESSSANRDTYRSVSRSNGTTRPISAFA